MLVSSTLTMVQPKEQEVELRGGAEALAMVDYLPLRCVGGAPLGG